MVLQQCLGYSVTIHIGKWLRKLGAAVTAILTSSSRIFRDSGNLAPKCRYVIYLIERDPMPVHFLIDSYSPVWTLRSCDAPVPVGDPV